MQCKVSINLKHAIFLGLRPCALVNFGRSASLCTYELWKEGNVPFMDSYAWEREASVRLIFQVYSCRPISGHEVWAGRDRLIIFTVEESVALFKVGYYVGCAYAFDLDIRTAGIQRGTTCDTP